MVNLKINGIDVNVPENTTILQASKKIGVNIPTLCYLKDVNEIGACRVCVVEIVGKERLVTACNTICEEGMQVLTDSKKALTARRNNVKLILSEHDDKCPSCVRNENCSLQSLAKSLNIGANDYEKHFVKDTFPKDFPLVRDTNKCIKCMRCINFCEKVQALGIWDVVGSGSRTNVGVKGNVGIKNSNCSLCGQCITHCPVGALRARDDTDKFISAINDKDKIVVVQVAPAVRVAWGEELGLSSKEASVKRLVTAVKKMGADYVFDTDYSADLTIMEEGSEFLERLPEIKKTGLPMFTSCCPGWVRFIKAKYPELVSRLSSAKSPQQMFGAVTKTYFAEKIGVDAEKIFCVSIMPCVAKKHECALDNMDSTGKGRDVDLSLTTREFVRLIKTYGIDAKKLEETEFDSPLGVSTGAGVIFGTTGGVMEAALRSAYYLVTNKNPDVDAFSEVRGMNGWKEAKYKIADTTINVAVAHGLKNTEKLIEAILDGKVQYDFVEIMACPGGCAGGGGQPIHDGTECAKVRGEDLLLLDKNSKLRFSHENPAVQTLYKEYLEKPLSDKAHELLHTDHKAWLMPNEKED